MSQVDAGRGGVAGPLGMRHEVKEMQRRGFEGDAPSCSTRAALAEKCRPQVGVRGKLERRWVPKPSLRLNRPSVGTTPPARFAPRAHETLAGDARPGDRGGAPV